MLIRSEPSQGAAPVWFVTMAPWPEIRAGLPEPGQAFAAGEAQNVPISRGFWESLAGFHRVETGNRMRFIAGPPMAGNANGELCAEPVEGGPA